MSNNFSPGHQYLVILAKLCDCTDIYFIRNGMHFLWYVITPDKYNDNQVPCKYTFPLQDQILNNYNILIYSVQKTLKSVKPLDTYYCSDTGEHT